MFRSEAENIPVRAAKSNVVQHQTWRKIINSKILQTRVQKLTWNINSVVRSNSGEFLFYVCAHTRDESADHFGSSRPITRHARVRVAD